jgi:hypothetical protein
MLKKVSVFYNRDVKEGSKAGNFVMLTEEVRKALIYKYPKRNRLVNYSLEPS